jgi:ATP-dependent DNA helicase RecG
VREQPHSSDDEEAWERQLANIDVLVEDRGRFFATVGGLLLFGTNPNKYLPQAGITATAFPAGQKEYATVDEEIIRGPLVSHVTQRGRVVDRGVIDQAIEFVRRNMGSISSLKGGRRRLRPSYPIQAVREALVNAVAHRDYTIAVTDIELSLFNDRLEVISPGRLPNTVTVEKMKQGFRAARNELLKEVLRDYGYVEHRGMGVPYKLIAGMREHNGTEPDLIEEEDRFVVRLWREQREV